MIISIKIKLIGIIKANTGIWYQSPCIKKKIKLIRKIFKDPRKKGNQLILIKLDMFITHLLKRKIKRLKIQEPLLEELEIIMEVLIPEIIDSIKLFKYLQPVD